MPLTANFHPTSPATQTLSNAYQGEALDYFIRMVERTYPANYIVAKVGSTHYAYKASTGGKIADTSTALTALQAAVDAAEADGGGIVHVKAGTYNLASSRLLCEDGDDVWVRGEGIGTTILQNGGIYKDSTAVQSNWTFSDFTIDMNDTAGHACMNLSDKATHYFVNRVEMKKTNDRFLLQWSLTDNCTFSNCIFIDGGRGVAHDNCAGSQDIATEGVTRFLNCYFQKDLSLGGGMLTTGGTGNIIVDSCTMKDNSNNSYAALSIENSFGSCKDIIVNNLRGEGKTQRIQLGIIQGDVGQSGSRGPIRRGLITNCDVTNGIQVRNMDNGEATISNCIIHDSDVDGYAVVHVKHATLTNCIVKNTNKGGSGVVGDKGGMYIDDVGSLSVTNFQAYDDQGTGTTPHGIRVSSGNTAARIVFNNIFLDGPFTNDALSIGSGLRIRVYGGRINGTTSITATDAKVFDVEGYLTNNTVLSPTFAIDSTGVKTVTIAHGLSITPAKEDCALTVLENTNVDDWAYNLLKVDTVGSTNVTAKINVSSASATGGATANLGLRVSKFG